MDDVLKEIGAVVLASLIFAVPILTTLSFALSWHPIFKAFLTLFLISEWAITAIAIYFN